MRADRLLALVMLLRSRRRVTAAELAVELEVSERTVLRDIEALSSAGVPVYTERGRHGGFALVEGWSSDLSGLSGDEARALLVAGSHTSASLGLGKQFASGLAKVMSSLPQQQREVAHAEAARILIMDEGFASHRESVPCLGIVQQAVLRARRLRLSYRTQDGVRTQRTVDPNGLVCANGRWYLLARYRGEARTYRVGRIVDARLTAETVDISAMPSLIEQWEQSRSTFQGRFIEIEVTVGGAAAALGRIRAAAKRSTLMSDDRCQLVFADEAQAFSVLWRYGADLAIEAPQSVRTELSKRALAILNAVEMGNGEQPRTG